MFLSHQSCCESGVHYGTAALRWIAWQGGPTSTAEVHTMLPVVDFPPEDEPLGFPGLYTTSLPQAPFLSDGHTAIINTQWRYFLGYQTQMHSLLQIPLWHLALRTD